MNDSEIDCLKSELEHEKSCRDTAAWQNGEIEKQIFNLQEDLQQSDYSWDGDDDLQRESSKHKHLLENIELLRGELPILKDRVKNAKICGADCRLKHDDLNINLDILTPSELLRTVKRFERLKTDLISTLRSKEWRLDSESKGDAGTASVLQRLGDVLRSTSRLFLHHHAQAVYILVAQGSGQFQHHTECVLKQLYVRVHDQRTYLQNELMIIQNNIMRLQRNGPYWQHSSRKHDERVMDPKRGPVKKMFGNERLPPIAT